MLTGTTFNLKNAEININIKIIINCEFMLTI